jgi:mono/diheme cytochrome c family protein
VSLSAAAEALGLPESLVQRSAEARAAETGQSVDDILAAWAGGETVPSAGAEAVPTSDETAGDETSPEAAAKPSEAEPETPPEPVTPVIDTPEPAATPAAPSRAPVPAEVTAAQAAHLPEVITVPTAGIKERTNFLVPKWLTALMLIAPLFALFALGGSSTGACGEATELTADVITGEIVNCDGSEFTGGGAGGGGTDFVALGGDIYNGAAVTGVNCAGCHGANGQGGVGPALGGVLTTFSACTEHEQWVDLGSGGWPDSTYGDTNKPVGGVGNMPGFGGTLTDEQLAAVVAFERVRFGGQNPDEALVDCGLAEPAEGGDGEGGAPPEDGVTSTTVATEGGGDTAPSTTISG